MKAASLMRWETMLAAVLIAAFVVFSILSPYFLSVDTLSDATFNFTERAIVAFVTPRLLPLEREFVQKNEFRVTFQPLDWRLNDLTGGRID